MLEALHALVAPAALERLTLVINHVLAGEPVATQRLRPHAGRCIALQLQGWPALLPPPPALAFRVTPAGLLEWCGADAAAALPDLRVAIDASNPALLGLRWLSGQAPAMDIQGDAAFAADVHWLADNLRWDVAADLEGLFGPVVARELERAGALFSAALQKLARTGGDLASRLRPDAGGAAAR
jgi:ubiquinone biosynthesis protein UbiJ